MQHSYSTVVVPSVERLARVSRGSRVDMLAGVLSIVVVLGMLVFAKLIDEFSEFLANLYEGKD